MKVSVFHVCGDYEWWWWKLIKFQLIFIFYVKPIHVVREKFDKNIFYILTKHLLYIFKSFAKHLLDIKL
jgi:hypothetical protein